MAQLVDNAEYWDAKRLGLERVLGKMHPKTLHAIVGWHLGGAVDLYRFPHALNGTAFATMELIEPDGAGPKPSDIGTYELVAFTRKNMTSDSFDATELQIWRVLTRIAHLSYTESLNPLDTCEISAEEERAASYLIFDSWKPHAVEFKIGTQAHGLLLCIEVFPSELSYAQDYGTATLLSLLKQRDIYPFSDLEREPAA